MISKVLKEQAYLFCEGYARKKLESLHLELDKIKEALQSETKSTAGDKHETGRAMLQLEREKLGNQLLEAEKMQETLKKVPKETKTDVVALGSLVQTDKAIYYISISAGKYKHEEQEVYCISLQTPIAQCLLGKAAEDIFEFNRDQSTIREVL